MYTYVSIRQRFSPLISILIYREKRRSVLANRIDKSPVTSATARFRRHDVLSHNYFNGSKKNEEKFRLPSVSSTRAHKALHRLYLTYRVNRTSEQGPRGHTYTILISTRNFVNVRTGIMILRVFFI